MKPINLLAEVPQLRLAFEKVTGRDLNWFFNEWYYNKGYPVLNINHSYNSGTHQLGVTIEQTQDLSSNPVFYMPLQIDIYSNGKKESHTVLMDKTRNSYVFDVASAPDLVVVDGKKMMLVCVKTENMSVAEREYQYEHLPLYLDRNEAMSDLTTHLDEPGVKSVVMKALHDPFWMIRKSTVQKLGKDSSIEMKNILIDLAVHDSSSNVRAAALSALSSTYSDGKLITLYRNALNDSSYKVENQGLTALGKVNKAEAMNAAKKLEKSGEKDILLGVAALYVQYGNDSCNNFFIRLKDYVSGFEQIGYVVMYGKFIQQSSDTVAKSGIPILEDLSKNGDNKYVKYYAKSTLSNLMSTFQDHDTDLKGQITDMEKSNASPAELNKLKAKEASCAAIVDQLNTILGN